MMKILSIYKARVIEFIDGETFRVEVDIGFDNWITRSFRVFGINTPEIFRPKSDRKSICGVLARDKAKEIRGCLVTKRYKQRNFNQSLRSFLSEISIGLDFRQPFFSLLGV